MIILNREQTKRVGKAVLILWGFNILAIFYLYPHYFNKVNEVYFLSVGEGDAELIKYNGRNIIIDAGPDRQILTSLNKILVPGEEVDLAIITHSNKDHYQGLAYILGSYPITSVLMPEISNPDSNYQELLADLREQNIKLYLAKADSLIKFSNTNFLQVLWPLTNNITSTSDFNSQALVILYKNLDKNFLFTSDIGQKEEDKILTLYPNLRADILKIAHHGSKTSNSFNWLEQLAPVYGVIEVGPNSYGHPSLEALNRLNELNILILRTDKNGNIGFRLDEEGVMSLSY
ncbi:MAG: MBL fold metallo-hydrolase [Candidatus Parcubacteria bacterium]|nr:MBL fold metallo-hydrolase [Candidatus Parcubacteria bacterium]